MGRRDTQEEPVPGLFRLRRWLMTDDIKKDFKTALAITWLAVEIIYIFYVGHVIAENSACHVFEFVNVPDSMMITLNMDTIVGNMQDGNEITIRAGTAVHPDRIHSPNVVFSYQGKHSYVARFEDFRECDQLKRMVEETNNRVREKQEQIIRESNAPVVAAVVGICWLLIGSVLTYLLRKIDLFFPLFALHVVLVPFFIMVPSNFLCR